VPLASEWSVPIPAGTSNEAWLATYQEPFNDCQTNVKEAGTVDGRPATISHTCGESHAFVFTGDRVYVFAVWTPNDTRLSASAGSKDPMLDAFISTVHLPADAGGGGG
jgi:hypothetical protein